MKNDPRRSSTKTLAKLEITHFGHLNRENKPRYSILADDQWTVVIVSFASGKLRMIDNVRPRTTRLSRSIRSLNRDTFISWSVRMTEKSASLVSTSSNGGLCNPPTKAVASVSGRRLSRRARMRRSGVQVIGSIEWADKRTITRVITCSPYHDGAAPRLLSSLIQVSARSESRVSGPLLQ